MKLNSSKAFSAFFNNSWNLYSLNLHKSQVVSNDHSIDQKSIIKNQYSSPNDYSFDEMSELVKISDDSLFVAAIPDPNKIYSGYELENADSIEQKNYKSKFKLDGISMGGGYDTYWGATGQAVLFFSDMLGNQIFIYLLPCNFLI